MGDTEGRRVIAKAAWLRWFMLWMAIIIVLGVASIWFDFIAIMGVLLSALSVVLLYQRFIKKRSWRSIMWGVHARGE
ncbi:MAG: hypothetical protein CL575_00345 [Altererythrobacter sp.]|nr:hypothetical protein [Altererythrobacter sp.]MAW90647.1 hypothetical protein [Altererythrobacter sp.]MBK61403.1 hypothetical protein [Altererythrobacter sp.]|tara:strand:+ start:5525 stop:5755 length:231 start_codon:yes stop_codon:yes gene_type:complete